MSKLRIIAPAALALTAAAVALSPVASADPASFLEELGWTGASLPGKTPQQVIDAGYATCADLKGGVSVLDEMSAVEAKYQFAQGTLFVSAATTHLCPDFAG